VQPDRMSKSLRAVANIEIEDSPVSTLTTLFVDNGKVGLRQS
jgi:hypothetical protein